MNYRKVWRIQESELEFYRRHWPSQRQGCQTRQKILKLLAVNGPLTLPEISAAMVIGERQVRKQLQRLIQEGKVERTENKKFSTRAKSKYLPINLKTFQEAQWN